MPNTMLQELTNIVGERNFFAADALGDHSNGYWDASPLQALALVTPESSTQLQEILACCNRHKQPVVVQGGLTGTVRGQLAHPDEIAISLSRMTRVIDFDPLNKTVVVEAGCTLQQIQQFARDNGLQFPIDIGSKGSCTIGGNIATNAGGMEVVRYGMMRNHVLGLEAVLADGTLISAMNFMKKNNTGYDLKQLFIGSEGSLGIVTKAVLQLQAAPTSQLTAMASCASFPDLTRTLDSAQRNLASSLTRFEVMDGVYYEIQMEKGGFVAPIGRGSEWYALIEVSSYHGNDSLTLLEEWLASLLADGTLNDATIAGNSRQRDELWEIRENFDVAIASKPVFLYDVSLPVSAMEAYVAEVRTAVSNEWPEALFFILGHMADGNLHFFLSPRHEGAKTELKHRADNIVYGNIGDFNGSVSAEHGIGLDKKEWLGHCRNHTEIELMKRIKRTLDPENLLNRGRIFDL